jgi:hypothetical protein
MTAYQSNEGTLVPLEKIRPKPGWQGPQFFNEEKAKCMADLMLRKETEFPPIEVEETKDGFYLILNGLHRFVASQRCSFTEIPVKIAPLGDALK